ncbi:SDR family oxidoreductase [Winslowiella iniecta]|uniref:Short-chain dehydrogenase n=1 Tax=Winslowiella iniecta TaxID=1560201 RepID=A0A0L7TFS1_9GAMM|nr:SDR family oxidoreductase [Winslowiella iniecta]KOC88169.1 short-chain dehydrogenase [Winslowiella iniecta]KOC94193.1 short-chain dehydrogenase [Winslowiella iniecta]
MNKTWLITGASSGLGRLMTEKLLHKGERVIAALRQPDKLRELQKRYVTHLKVLPIEMTDTDTLRTTVSEAFAWAGRIDVVVSNAGYGLFGAAEELDDQQIGRQLATNLTGSIQLIRAVLPFLRRQGGGRILQVSSEGGQIAYPNFSLYHASKWGIEGFIEAVSQEVAEFAIDFIIAEPGPTATGFAAGLDQATALPCYGNTASGRMRKAVSSGEFEINGDADKTVEMMINCAIEKQPPFRLPLGSTAFANIKKALQARLTMLESLETIACSTDRS